MKRATLILSVALMSAFGLIAAVPLAKGDHVAWARFQDPAEQAFTLQVPLGWKVVGGLYRFGILDPRIMVDMTSPNGQTNIRLGDASVPPFFPLSPTLYSLGWREGHPYSPNGVAQGVVADYRPGWVFADLYGQARFGPLCRNLELKEWKRDVPIEQNPQGQTTAGEALYACDTAEGPKIAFVFAETHSFPMPAAGIWMVTYLGSFIAPVKQTGEALQIMLHASSTLTVSDQWEAMQLRLNGAAGNAAYAQFKKNMASEQAHFEQQSAQSQSQAESFDRAMRGVDLTRDPVTGKEREVLSAGPGITHWFNATGQTVNSPTQPGPGFRSGQPVH